MPPIHESQFQCGIGRTAQADYATIIPVATQLKGLVPTNRSNFIDYSNSGGSNKGHATGSDFASETWIERHDATVEVPLRFNTEDAGQLFFLKLGSISTALLLPNSQHTIKRQNPNTAGRQLPVTTYYEAMGALKRTMHAALLQSLKIMGKRGEQVQCSATLRGSGKIIEGETRALDYTEAKHYVWFAGLSLNFGGVEYKCDAEEFALDLSDTLLDGEGYRACSELAVANDYTSGQYRSELLVGDSDYKLNFTVRAAVNSPLEQRLRDKAKVVVVMDLAATPTHGCQITTKVVVDSVKRTSANGIVTLAASCTVMTDLGANVNDPITVLLSNEVPSYTV